MHLIRNAVDHGIESGQVRQDLGKREERQNCLSGGKHGGRTAIDPE